MMARFQIRRYNDPEIMREQEAMSFCASGKRISGCHGASSSCVLPAVLCAMLLLTYPTAALAAAHGGSGRVTLGGQVGFLHLDRSTEADVISLAGHPDATATGNFRAIPRDPNYYAIGYVCQEHLGRWLFRVDRFDYCRTVFFINTWTHRLTAFFSSSRRYSFRGASPGMSTAKAARHIHRHALIGCIPGFGLGRGLGKGPASFIGAVARSPGHQASGSSVVISQH